MLREHINDIMTRWSPKERRGSLYDPVRFLETPEQARKLIRHLQQELNKARRERNKELVSEVGEILYRVEQLSKKFFRWEEKLAPRLKRRGLAGNKETAPGLLILTCGSLVDAAFVRNGPRCASPLHNPG